MWTRQRTEHPSDEEEKRERERLTSLLSGQPEEAPDPAYWQELMAGTNRRIDNASSARALSVSWVARVAIPGAVSILFFFIGLHYYVPERKPDQVTVIEIVSMLPEESQDSLVAYLLDRTALSDSGLVFYGDLLELSEDEVEQYMVASGHTAVLLKSLPDEHIGELISLLQTRKRTSRF